MKRSLYYKYPPSVSCSCDICRSYCIRPGWWTVEQAKKVISLGLSNRMMIEVSPEFDFGVLSPAFIGCEGGIALQTYSKNGCNFYKNGLCELYKLNLLPLECAYCHHSRVGMGIVCHLDIEKDWDTEVGKQLVYKWLKIMGINKDNIFLQAVNMRSKSHKEIESNDFIKIPALHL